LALMMAHHLLPVAHHSVLLHGLSVLGLLNVLLLLLLLLGWKYNQLLRSVVAISDDD
jgi:hypothetical protein